MAIITYDENLEKIKNMEVTIYQEPEKISDVLSKARLRIFYKGMNRNHTFISEDFALKLENSLPYTPVKGIYDDDIQDFEGHGEEKDDGRKIKMQFLHTCIIIKHNRFKRNKRTNKLIYLELLLNVLFYKNVSYQNEL